MKQVTLMILALTLIISATAEKVAYAGPKDIYRTQLDEQAEKIKALEAEVKELKEGQGKLEEKNVRAKLPVKLYGFIDAQTIWGDSTVRSLGALDSIAAITNAADEDVVGGNDAFFGITPQNTRVGLLWTPTEFDNGLAALAKLELDFLNIGGGLSPRPRIRLAYAALEGKSWSLLGGQEWDVFSPLNTATQHTGGNLWFAGNLGFRRPQLKFTYKIPTGKKDAFILAISANNPGNFDTVTNETTTSGLPYGEASVTFTHPMNEDLLTAAISGVFGRDNSPARKINIWGIAASIKIPAHRFFTPSGEFQYGVDLADFLSNCGLGARRRVIAAWGQITSQWHKKLQTNLGYGVESLKADQVTVGNVGSNQFGFANLWFYPVKPFGIGLEYDHIRTWYRGSNVSHSNLGMASIKYDF